MSLVDKQFEFAMDVGRLLCFAAIMAEEAARAGDAIQITLGDAFEDQTRIPKEHWIHSPGSLHSLRLAIDVNLFVNGIYIKGASSYWTKLGKFWKSIRNENTWGGDFSAKDWNHFSRSHGGRK